MRWDGSGSLPRRVLEVDRERAFAAELPAERIVVDVEAVGRVLGARSLVPRDAARDPFRLAALSPLVTISGSLVIALALAEGEIGLEQAWTAAMLDEAWQAEKWGEDPLAVDALAARRRAFDAAYLFLTLL